MEDVKWLVELLNKYGIDAIVAITASIVTAVIKSDDKRKPTKKLERWYWLLPFYVATIGTVLRGFASFDYAAKITVIRCIATFFAWISNAFICGCLATGGYKFIDGFRKQRKV